MLNSRTLVAATSVAALALALAGCSGGASGGSGDSKKEGLTWEDSPMTEYFASLSGEQEDQQAIYEEQTKKREEILAKCMSDEGFDYTPNVGSADEIFTSDGEDMWRPDDKDWVEKYGYGVANDPWSEQNESDMNAPADDDPNQKYLEGLSEAQQTAYYDALYGKQTDQEMTVDEDGNENYEYDWEKAGCQGQADHEVNGADMELFDKYEDLFDRMNDLYTKAEKAPEMADLNTKWSACMTESGYAYKVQSEPAEEFSKQLEDLYSKYTEDADWEKGDPTAEDRKELAKTEVKVALDDLACREKTNYNDEKLKVQFKLEEQFIKDNKKELDEYKAAQEELMKG